MKIDKVKYENDPEYKQKIDRRRERNREYMRAYMRRKSTGVVVSKTEKTTAITFRCVICTGCSPHRACQMTVPCTSASGSVIIHCPCDGTKNTGVIVTNATGFTIKED